MNDYQITPHFRLSEFTQSATAERLGIDNTPDSTALHNIELLCRYVLEPIRQAFGQPIVVNSGYRCRQLNIAVGGAKRSFHLSGRAADIVAGPVQNDKSQITNDKSQITNDKLQMTNYKLQITNDKFRMTNQMEANRRLKAVIDDLGLHTSELIYEKPARDGTPRWIHIAI